MIVKDEKAIIRRCLDAARPHIDHYTIVDTGSTDGTGSAAKSALCNTPGKVYHRPWVDFGHNRAEALDLARGTADWLLFLDADMVVHAAPDLREQLDGIVDDALDVKLAGAISYRLPLLVRGDREWTYTGRTHEYLNIDGTRRPFDGLLIDDVADGSQRAEKWERDAAILREEVDRDPRDARSWFYLARTLDEMGERRDAVHAYEKRMWLGGWDQELFCSSLRLGVLTGDHRKLFDAADRVPRRWPEVAQELAAAARLREDYETALAWSSSGMAMAEPRDGLFVQSWVYEWGLRCELSVAAWWLGQKEEAASMWRHLLDSANLSVGWRQALEANLAVA